MTIRSLSKSLIFKCETRHLCATNAQFVGKLGGSLGASQKVLRKPLKTMVSADGLEPSTHALKA
jgi:hypothetical protein